ncbi:Nitrilotriacetate monooxygenase component A [Wickerhamomyces ciferrii]|uniref:Nitrilotriacetate monooxygenase component A n=1 Tax=Wickerhamomyces ciferrii (strain ATCC 14091 / BCRC 22168 / CBS 111 / JCM 3599 / NBRC 0793 / NRRL Y-1031 F-60-10) TaxID=1206466 RepID=K0KW53_WICCF|nr:Nitrilotriacetate monooxygenase component A [Wickerhamomyces ciferrii]CCH46207.1 Nitrilotriacetate monooxygenase component A [Wickerhamomyces ciferrii]
MTKKELILNILTGGHTLVWRNPADESRNFTNSIDSWVKFAKLAERGKIHSVFIADHLTFFDSWKGPGNFKDPARAGVHAPRIDPAATITAMSSVTENIGFGITFSTVSEHPYHFARRLASLDLLTNGRVGWNIVSSYLESIGPNLLNGEPFPEHDERYIKTDEYVEVVLKLLLSSWREDAVKYDKENGIFADPDLIRKINHKGKYFSVEGPGITEPTPQGFPVIFQAGTSNKGKQLAARLAEVVFVDARNNDVLANDIKEIRSLAKTYGRDPYSIKFVASATPIIAATHEEAVQKVESRKAFSVPNSGEIGFSGISGIDLSKFKDDEEVIYTGSNGLQTITSNIIKKAKKNNPTKAEVLKHYTKKNGNLVGSPQEVADELEKWVEDFDIDGFNFSISEFPGGIEDIVDLLVPELQKRGLFHTEYSGSTFRESLNEGKGSVHLREDHPAHKSRWTSDLSKEQFESQIK